MLGPVDYLIWFISFAIEVYVVVLSLVRGFARRYFSLVFYMLALAAATAGRFYILHYHGFHSEQYVYFYYYSDCLLTILLFGVIIGFYRHVFGEMGASRYIRAGAVLLLAGTAWFSYLVVHSNTR